MSETAKQQYARINDLIKMVERVGLKDLRGEKELMLSKWPEYKFLSPHQATSLFARKYREQFRRFFERDIDRSKAPHVSGADPRRKNADFKAFWTQRRNADELGLPYEEYIAFCMEFRLAKVDRTTRAAKLPPIPRPNQLGPSSKSPSQQQAWASKLHDYLEAAWRPQVLSKLGELPQYRLDAYKGLPAQDSFQELALQAVIWRKGNWRDAMRRLSVDRHQLSQEMFRQILSSDVYEMACEQLDVDLKVCPPVPMDPLQLQRADYWQSCFGVPGERDPNQKPCASCALSQNCQKVADHVLAVVRDKHQVDDPVEAKKRAQGRERTRRFRAKEKEGATLC